MKKNKKEGTASQKKPSGSQRKKGLKHSSGEGEASQEKMPCESFPVVGIGASAGGLEAFEQFFTNMTPDSGMAFVVISHLDPKRQSMLSELLSKYTTMPVAEVKDEMRAEPNHVYVIPPNKDMAIYDKVLHLSEPEYAHGIRMPVDFFFRSLARDCGKMAVCVILSGSGSDGSLGLRAINEAGGVSLVQEASSARYDSMPLSAIRTGLVDYVLPVEKIPQQLLVYSKHIRPVEKTEFVGISETSPELYKKILVLVKAKTGHNFSLYKKTTINRRIERRMNLHEIEDPSVYVRYLQENPNEITTLFKELLIVVTSFFRDTEAFETLKNTYLPALLESRPEKHPVRIWVPGCATGEEVYSLAIVLRECMDTLKREFSVKIFGTDIDGESISKARTGIYTSNIAIDVSPERLNKYFVKEENVFRIRKDIREMALFAIQDVIRDAPFIKMDIISCRNLLIYLGNELQSKIIPLFHYSLNPNGILFLGSSESIGVFSNIFTVIDRKWKFFRRKEAISPIKPAIVSEPTTGLREAVWVNSSKDMPKRRETSIEELAKNVILDNLAPPCVIINETGNILYVHGRTGKYLEPAHGRASLNIFDMTREGLQFELRSAIHRAVSRKRNITCEGLRVKANGGFQSINLKVKPIINRQGLEGLVMVIFEDVATVKRKTAGRKKDTSVQKQSRRIEELERALKYNSEELRDSVEMAQASIEEQKALNEELQSSNEELQSTNEELETSKEELQSVNEELVTVNSELQIRLEQLAQAENDLRNFLDCSNIGVIYLDNNLRIRHFTSVSDRVFNLITTDIGRSISHIASNLEYKNLFADIQTVHDGLVPKEIEVQTKEKDWYLIRIVPYITTEKKIEGVVITFTDINQMKKISEDNVKLRSTEAALKYTTGIIDTLKEPLVVLDASLRVVSANKSFYEVFHITKDDTTGKFLYQLCNNQWDIPDLRKLLEEILPKNTCIKNYEIHFGFPSPGKKKILLSAHRIILEGAGTQMILIVFADTGVRKFDKK